MNYFKLLMISFIITSFTFNVQAAEAKSKQHAVKVGQRMLSKKSTTLKKELRRKAKRRLAKHKKKVAKRMKKYAKLKFKKWNL